MNYEEYKKSALASSPELRKEYEALEPQTNTYQYVLRQEVLDEAAQNVFNELSVYMCNHDLSLDDETPYAALLWELSDFKRNIISSNNKDDVILDGISAQIKLYRQRVRDLISSR